MLWKLILLLTVVPIVELYLLVKLTQATSFGLTVLVILGTGVVGAFLARMEGLRVLSRIKQDMHEFRLPADNLLDAGMILVAAALLVTPGLLTDTVGFLLLLPLSRGFVRALIKRWIKRRIELGQVQFYQSMGFGPPRDQPAPDAQPLESEEKRDRYD